MPKMNWTNIAAVALMAVVWVAQTAMCVGMTHNPMVDSFLHANWAHLALNCWALYWLWRKPRWLIIPAYAFGCVGLWLDGNAIGLSAMLYALMGLQWHLYDSTRNRIIMAASLLVAGLVPQLAFVAHLVPFVLALAFGWLGRLVINYNHDVNRR